MSCGLGLVPKGCKGWLSSFITLQRSSAGWPLAPVIGAWDPAADSTVLLRRSLFCTSVSAQGGTTGILSGEGRATFAGAIISSFLIDSAKKYYSIRCGGSWLERVRGMAKGAWL